MTVKSESPQRANTTTLFQGYMANSGVFDMDVSYSVEVLQPPPPPEPTAEELYERDYDLLSILRSNLGDVDGSLEDMEKEGLDEADLLRVMQFSKDILSQYE